MMLQTIAWCQTNMTINLVESTEQPRPETGLWLVSSGIFCKILLTTYKWEKTVSIEFAKCNLIFNHFSIYRILMPIRIDLIITFVYDFGKINVKTTLFNESLGQTSIEYKIVWGFLFSNSNLKFSDIVPIYLFSKWNFDWKSWRLLIFWILIVRIDWMIIQF